MVSEKRFLSLTRSQWGWAIYDWGNSAFATTVMAGFFPIFFKSYWSVGANVNESTAQLGAANSLGGLLVALLAPILGAVADRSSNKKRFLITFAYLGVVMTAALFFVGRGEWKLAVFLYVMGVVGFSGGNVFYDALIIDVSTEPERDKLSGIGFGLGYLGGGILFAINVLMTLMPELFGLANAAEAVRVSFLSVAAWWGCFTIFTIFWLREARVQDLIRDAGNPVKAAFRKLRQTLGKMGQLKNLFLFLLAYFVYIDGVDTVIRMAVDYGISLGFKDTDLISALLLVQFIGFPAAILYTRFGYAWGVRKAIFLAIFLYLGITVGGVFVNSVAGFYALAVGIGMVQGGIQALSRSYYARFVPEGQAGEFYGFYNMIGKSAVVFGPLVIAAAGLLSRSLLVGDGMSPEEIEGATRLASRISIGSVAIFFILGAILFNLVDEDAGREEAKRFVA